MTRTQLTRPSENEHLPYFGRYISLAPEGDILATLETQGRIHAAELRRLTEAQGGYRYAEGKWSIKEVVGHIADAERVFADRALRIARGDRTSLPGFDENSYVANAAFDRCALEDLIQDWENVRRSTLSLFRLMDDAAVVRMGTANGADVSVRAVAYIVAGHELHHMKVLQERYLDGALKV